MTWVRISCAGSLAALRFETPRPVDAGLGSVLAWDVEAGDEDLVLKVDGSALALVDPHGSTGDRWVLDILDES